MVEKPENRQHITQTKEVHTDAVPKKRGPKTDVLEALLKRVDGLERRLKDEGKSNTSPSTETSKEGGQSANEENQNSDTQSQRPKLDTISGATLAEESAVYSPPPPR